MEDYSKLKKEELLEKLLEQKHLSEAISVKDKELFEFKKEVNTLRAEKKELLDKSVEQKHLSEAINAKDKEIAELKKEVNTLKVEIKQYMPVKDHKDIVSLFESKLKSFEGAVKKEDIEKYIKKADEDRQKAFAVTSRYINAYRDLLKVFKVNLDIAISTDELLSETLKIKGE